MLSKEKNILEDFIRTLAEIVNDTTCNVNDHAEVLVESLMYEHRYLQSKIIRVFVHTLIKYGQLTRYDDRNEWVIELCKKITKAVEEFDHQ